MNFWEIVGGIIVSFGGVAGIVALIVKFSGNMIAERLSKKYDLKLNKELESLKSNLERKNYISKTRFDAEFKIYQELSQSFFDMVKGISIMIPAGFVKIPADEAVRKKYEDEAYSNAHKYLVNAQDSLNGNTPFIPKDFCDKYGKILQLCRRQINVFEQRFDALSLVPQTERERFEPEDYNRTEEINNEFQKLNDSIRDYLFNLDVVG